MNVFQILTFLTKRISSHHISKQVPKTLFPIVRSNFGWKSPQKPTDIYSELKMAYGSYGKQYNLVAQFFNFCSGTDPDTPGPIHEFKILIDARASSKLQFIKKINQLKIIALVLFILSQQHSMVLSMRIKI